LLQLIQARPDAEVVPASTLFFHQGCAHHDRDLLDVLAMVRDGLPRTELLWQLFTQIEPWLLRYPANPPGYLPRRSSGFLPYPL
jgi:hypothetical protein